MPSQTRSPRMQSSARRSVCPSRKDLREEVGDRWRNVLGQEVREPTRGLDERRSDTTDARAPSSPSGADPRPRSRRRRKESRRAPPRGRTGARVRPVRRNAEPEQREAQRESSAQRAQDPESAEHGGGGGNRTPVPERDVASDYARSPQTMSPWGRLRTGSSQDQPEMSHSSYVRRRTRSQPTNDGPTHPVGEGGDPSCLVVQTRQREQGCCWQLVFPGRIYEGGPGVLGAPPDTTHRPVESIRPRA